MVVTISTCALLLAGTSSIAFADTSSSTTSSTTSNTQVPTIQVPATQSTTQTPTIQVPAQNSTTGTSATSQSTPPVLPGDYFYDVASCAENVQLDVTPDDTMKAELLAQFANEKIEDSDALLRAGEKALAEQIIQQALADQILAVNLGGTGSTTGQSSTDLTGTSTSGNNNTQQVSGTNNPQQQINVQITNNLQALFTIIQQIKDPAQKQAVLSAISDAFRTLSNALAEENVHVDTNFGSDQGDQEDQSDDNNGDNNNQDNQGMNWWNASGWNDQFSNGSNGHQDEHSDRGHGHEGDN